MRHENLKLRSPAFAHEETIPSKYTCDGENISPPLAISGVPEGTVTMVLIMEDPDVPRTIREDGMWNHWLLFNIPSNTAFIAEGEVPACLRGLTTRNVLEYGGPCPPDGEHRYLFRLYALDTTLDIEEGSTKDDIHVAMRGHVLESTTLIGRYTRVVE